MVFNIGPLLFFLVLLFLFTSPTLGNASSLVGFLTRSELAFEVFRPFPSQTGTSFLGRLDPSDPIWGLFVVLLLVEEFWPLNEALPPSTPPPPPPPWLNE